MSDGSVTGGKAAPAAVYCCYGCCMVAEVLGTEAVEERTPEERALLYRLFIGTLLAGFTMVLSVAISSGYGFGTLRTLRSNWDSSAHWVLLCTALPTFVLLGPPVLRGAIQHLRSGRLTLDVLFALGTTSAIAASALSFARGTGPVYLETAAMLLALYTLGRYLDARARGETARVLQRLLDVPTIRYERLSPDPGAVFPEALRVGDRVQVRAGDLFPVDGKVLRGRGFVDEARLTGEGVPAGKWPGDTVYAGTASLDGAFIIRVTATGAERRLARIEQLMREAMARPPRLMQTTDRILRWLIPGIIMLALATFVGWYAAAGFERALYAALSVVLIACPCALGLAIPLVLNVALSGAARRGILIRSGQSLLDLDAVRAVVLDKTGTLTGTTPGTVRVVVPTAEVLFVGSAAFASAGERHHASSTNGLLARETGGDRLLALAAAVEQGIHHPLAEAICAEATRRGLRLPILSEAQVLPGVGVQGVVWEDGVRFDVAVGNQGVLSGDPAEAPFLAAARDADSSGSRTLFMVVEGQAAAVLLVEERPRDNAQPVVEQLHGEGLHIEIVSGDGAPSTRALAHRLAVPYQGDAAPEEKLARVEALRSTRGPVALVGDGINDAAALAAADVGIALASGATLAVEAADITLYNPDLRSLPWLVRLAHQTRRTIRQNLVWTFVYNAFGLALAVAGLLHPLVAVVVMVLSSAFVTWNALRLPGRLPEYIPA